jgi:hypothetical protein
MTSSGELRHVALVKTEVSEKLIASITLMMEAIRSSETLVLTRATRHNIPEDGILRRAIASIRSVHKKSSGRNK